MLILLCRYPSLQKVVHYKYRFQCPDSSYYDPASFDLQMEILESVPWNIIDNVVCSHGMGDYQLSDVRSRRVHEIDRCVNCHLDIEVLAYTSGIDAGLQGLHGEKY